METIMSRLSDARNTILGYAFGSAGVVGVFKVFVPIPAVEVGLLTAVTIGMCNKIARIYGYESLSGISTFIGVLVGAANGVKLATSTLDLIPGIGAGANAIATFTLHTVTGIALIIVFELLDAGEITNKDIQKSPIGFINALLGAATSVIGGFVRGDFSGAIESAKHEFSRRWQGI
jgi:uncharacterized protein (DUF697 family)